MDNKVYQRIWADPISCESAPDLFDVPGSDCGTAECEDVTITLENVSEMVHRYIMDNGEPIELKFDNVVNYLGKTVQLRSPQYCKGKKLCEVCSGNLIGKILMCADDF